MWLNVLRQWRGVRNCRAVLPRSAQRVVRREVFRPALEGLESRWCPSLTLTQAGRDAGIALSTFAVDFPHYNNGDGDAGPFGMAFPSSGGVLVSDIFGNVRGFPTDNDGQSATWFTPGQNYGVSNALGMAQVGGSIYLAQQNLGRLIRINDDGTPGQIIVPNLVHATGIVANPANGHLFITAFVSGQGSSFNNSIVDVDSSAGTYSLLVGNLQIPDGVVMSDDGSSLYVAVSGTGHVLGFDPNTQEQIYDSGVISGIPDGIVEGTGPLAGKLFVNTNSGTVVEVDIATGQQTVIASGGSRGDFVTIDPRDGSALFTQTDRIVRFTFPFGAARRLTVGGFPSSSTAGAPGSVTVTALDQNGMLATGYTGTVHFTSNDPQATLPADYTFTAADRGQHTFTNGITLTTAGSQTITVTDTSDPRLTASQAGIVVMPAAASTLLVSDYPSPTVAGQVNGFTVTAQDPYGNTATDYRGTVHVTSSDSQAFLEGDYTFTAADNGSHPFGTILKTVGTQALTVTDTSDDSITGTQDGIVVTPAPAVSFALSAPASVSSGTPFDVTVTALDPYGNTDTNHQGTVTFATSDTDPGVVLPPDYTFQPADAGMVIFPGGVTLITPGDQTLTVTDTVSGITGGATVTVTAGDGPERSQRRGATSETTATSTGPNRTALADWFPARLGRRYGSRTWVALAEASSVHRRLAVGPIEVALVDESIGPPLA